MNNDTPLRRIISRGVFFMRDGIDKYDFKIGFLTGLCIFGAIAAIIIAIIFIF